MKTGLRGALIVLEGCDRCGKTTQCAKLLQRLLADGKKVELIKFPDRTTAIGTMIDGYLKQKEEIDDHAVHLLFSANRWEAMKKMTDLLMSGTTLIVDRYAYSGIAYTAAKGLDVQWCRQPDVGLIKPDKVFYLSVNGDKAAERSQFGQERYEKRDFQAKANHIFMSMKEPSYWKMVDGDGSIEDVHTEIYTEAAQTVEQVGREPLLKLWTNGTIDGNEDK